MIIGAMKCGTTSLFTALAQHPQVCAARVKEPEFFSAQQAHRQILACYSDLWEFDAARHRIALEASTGYTKYPTEQSVAARIADAGLRPKFIYILRDPLERMESHYNFGGGTEDWFTNLESSQWLATSDYATQLAQFLPHFARSDFLLLDFAQLRSAPQATMQRVLQFLQLEPLPQFSRFPVANPTQVPAAWQVSLAQGPGRWLRAWPAGHRLASTTFARIAEQFSRRPPLRRLSAAERSRIRARLAPSMRTLASEWQVDVSAWGFE